MEILQYINLAGALAAFFMAGRVIVLDRRALAVHRRSWMALTAAVLLLVALMAIELLRTAGIGPDTFVVTILETALVAALIAGFFFLYVQEHSGVSELSQTATHETERSQRLSAILALGDEVRTTLDVDKVVATVADAVSATLDFRENAIYLLDTEREAYVAKAAVGGDADYNQDILGRSIPQHVVEGLIRDEFRRGNCYFVDHTTYEWTEEELFYFPSGDFECEGPGHFHPEDGLFVPLLDHEEHMLGLFDVYNPEDGLLPSATTLQMLEILANVAASAIENARYGEAMRQLAITDGLTGLYNHRHFQEMLGNEVERAERYGLTFTLLMMDLDLFKTVNDRLGHPRGDEALREVAAVLTREARASDFVARYGGEEFVMILPGTSSKQATAAAERVRAGVRAIALPVPEPPALSISIGVADFPTCGRERESLIAAADTALLFAKRAGRDMVMRFADASLADVDAQMLEALAFHLENADIETAETFANAVELRDGFGGNHSLAVAESVTRMLDELELDEVENQMMRLAALIYDIGKIGVPVDVLNARGELGSEQLDAIRQHPEIGKQLIESTVRLARTIPAVLHHHERWDGTGYPDGMKGEEIPISARVIAICDSYEAMISDRPYRTALTKDEALAELRHESGKQFDPDLVERFIACLPDDASAGKVAKGPAQATHEAPPDAKGAQKPKRDAPPTDEVLPASDVPPPSAEPEAEE